MSESSSPTATEPPAESLVNLPSQPVGYLMVGAALVTGVIHLFLSVNVINFSQTLGILFALNGIGFLGTVALYMTKFWRRELYIAAALYALVTIIALFVFQGFSLDAFMRQGSVNPMAVIAKLAEVVVVVCAAYLFTQME